MIRSYNSPYDFKAAFTDQYGKTLVNASVQFIVDGILYNCITDENGISTLKIGLNVGKHIITTINPASDESIISTVNIVKRIDKNSNLIMFYEDGSSFKVRLFGDDGNIEQTGKTVSFNIGGKIHTAKTDKNGYASVKITLKPGKYSVTVNYLGFSTKNIITVKNVINVKSISKVKKSSKVTKIKITLKAKKALKNKKITIKFNGKKYKTKTNKKGVAYFKVTKKMVKKLKKNKKYSYTVTYSKSIVKKIIKIG